MSRIIFVVVITRLTRDHVNIEPMYFSRNRIAVFFVFYGVCFTVIFTV